MNRQISHSAKPMGGWIRSVSTDSNSSNNAAATCIPSPPSSEVCALTRFAYTLGSIVRNNDPSIVNNNDVRREAKLLMSLSCSSPIHGMGNVERRTAAGNDNNKEMTQSVSSSSSSSSSSTTSGRNTPVHSITSTGSSTSTSTSVGSSRRSSFCFTCPSLSLNDTRNSNSTNTPGSMLSRTLKVDDKDALRLSSEAMARNVIESFQKAMEWRIQSWVDSLSRVLVIKEREFSNDGNQQHELIYSNEALLVAALREIEGKVQVREATTAFKVMNKVSSVDEMGTPLKKQRLVEQEQEEEDCRSVLEEGEYFYDVIHVLEMQCSLNISSPAGNVQIDLNVPGKIQGSFLSSEEDHNNVDKLTDVTIDLNTEMLASMIEKSSRVAVRASTEALLKGEHVTVDLIEQAQATTKNSIDTTTKKLVQQQRASSPTTTAGASSSTPHQTRTPKRKASDDEANYVTGLMVVTPASRESASSTSSYCESSDSDGDNIKPVRLHIPDNFPSFEGKLIQPQVSRASYHKTQQQQQQTTPVRNLDFAARLPSKKRTIITPTTKAPHHFIERVKGPSLPVLVEVACAAIYSKKKN